MKRHAEAVRDWDRALEIDAGPLRLAIRLYRAVSLGLLGEVVKASTEIEEIIRARPRDADLCCHAACAFARWASKVGDADEAERHATRAVALLRDAIATGFKDVSYLKKDRDLAHLRPRADFQKLVADLEAARTKP